MIHQKHKDWIEMRGLSPELAELLGLETVQRDGAFWLSIPYRLNGETINHKYRLTSEKRHSMDGGSKLTLWNVDILRDPQVQGGASVIITEGEWDAMAVIQSGFRLTVSVPNGAPSALTDDPGEAARYSWVWTHKAELEGVKEFILATDGDGPGANLAADLAALLGPERCKFVTYPAGYKDFGEVLFEFGTEEVAKILAEAKPYPVKGLFSISDFPEKGEVRAYDIGIPAISEFIKIVPGTLTVVTGYANMGKSTMMNLIIANAMMKHFPVCVASFETDVKPILRDGLQMAMLKCGKHELHRMDKTDVDDIMADRLRIISQSVDEDSEMGLEEFLEICRIAVVRDGVKMIVLDPWNELEHKRRDGENETEYVSRALRAIKRFAKVNDVAFWIVAHPSKPMEGVKKVPGLYDVSGSANWANKPDYGITYHRPKSDENGAVMWVNKVRMGLPGKRGKVKVEFDFRTSEFRQIEEMDDA